MTEEQFNKLDGWFWWEEAVAMKEALNYIKDLNGIIVECGSYKGKSTACMASNTNSTIYAIDPFNWDNGTYDKFKEQTKYYNNIRPIQKSAVDAIHDIKNTNEPIKLLFIDCDHTYQLTKQIYNLYLPLMTNGGIILFHDCSPINYYGFPDNDGNEPIHDIYGGWIGPTKVLWEARMKHKQWVEGARSLHGIQI